jgi:hypothetical protein
VTCSLHSTSATCPAWWLVVSWHVTAAWRDMSHVTHTPSSTTLVLFCLFTPVPCQLPSADPQWNSPQEAAPATGGSRLAQSTGDELGPMESAAPLQTHAGSGYAGGLSAVAIHGRSDGGTTSWPPANGSTGLPGKAAGLVGRRPSVQLAADGRATGAGGQAPVPAPHFPALPVGGLAGRQESAGFEYAPDSKAVMARINRWWKKLDEGYMQPRFGGPARAGGSSSQSHVAAAAAAAGPAAAQGTPSLQGVQAPDDNFTLPVRMA